MSEKLAKDPKLRDECLKLHLQNQNGCIMLVDDYNGSLTIDEEGESFKKLAFSDSKKSFNEK